MSAKWLMQCCARAIEPGCHADCVLILEGSQGAGKNTLMEALLPVSDWGVSLSSSSIDKDTVVSLEGKWIGEFAEMHTASRTDVKLLKAFITQRIDHYRKAYRRDHKSNPRLTVFWAATNDSEYLADDTGGRRWWPVEVRGVVHVEEIKDDDGSPKLFLDAQSVRDLRDQLWGEAFARVRSGESYKLTSSEARIAEEKQKAKLIVDPWESVVVEHLENFQVDTGFSTTTLLANAIGMETARQNVTEERRVAKILRKLGYEQRRQYEIDGSRPRRWYKK